MAEITKFAKKLTDEAATYAAIKLAQEVPAPQIVREIKESFGITITSVRISQLTKTARWDNIYTEARRAHLNNIRDYTGIALAAQRERLQAGDALNKRIHKFMDKIERRIDENEKYRVKMHQLIDSLPGLIGDAKALKKLKDDLMGIAKLADTGSELGLIKELRALIETSLKTLNYGRTETEAAIGKNEPVASGVGQFKEFMKNLKKIPVYEAEVVPDQTNGDNNGESTKV